MTDYEKAWQISHDCYMPDTGFDREDLYDSAMEIAEWKEKQVIEKVQDFIVTWFYEHPHEHNLICSDAFENVDQLLEKLKKTMEEQL